MKPKIIVDSDIPYIRGRLEPFAEVLYRSQFEFTPEEAHDASALVIRTRTRCNADLLQGSSVRLIATATIGMDQFDLPWCQAAGIETRNAPGCNAPAVAQYVWSLLLRTGFDPARHTLGIIGCGNVGSIVARWGERLGARILVSDPPKAERGELQYPDTPLETLLRESDAVTLHVPMTREEPHATFHLIGERELAMMRDSAWIINAARGPVADNAALVKAIPEKHLKAIIDTWEGEPAINTELLRLAEIPTFHIAGYSAQGKQRATRMALEAVSQFFGWDIDISGLEGPYIEPEILTPEKITASFDPQPIADSLRRNPELFDRLRADYVFRDEVK